MLKNLLLAGFLLCGASFQLYAQDEINPIRWTLKTEKPSASLNKGDSFNAALSAEIEKGWHLYALEKIDGGPIPTRISVADESPFEIGKIIAPAPIEVDDSNFGTTTKFYEDAVKFDLPFKVSDKFEKEKSELKVRVRYQTCNDQMCLPPKTVIILAEAQ